MKKGTVKWAKSGKKKIKIRKIKKTEKKAKDPVQKAQGTVAKPKSKRSTPARFGDAIKVSAREGQSYADILNEMKANVDPWRTGLEVLSIQRTRKEEVHLVLKRRGEVSAFCEELTWAVGERAEISTLVSTRSPKIRDLDEAVKKEVVDSALCLALPHPGARRISQMLQVPCVQPRITWLWQSRQKRCL